MKVRGENVHPSPVLVNVISWYLVFYREVWSVFESKKGEGNKGLAFTLKCLIMMSLCASGEEVKAIFEKQRMRA